MDTTDPALVARVLRGEAEAFRFLVERHGRHVFQLAFRMTGNAQDAEDVVQETFLRAFRHLKRYESRSLFSTWLYRIAANCAVDLMRAQRHFTEHSKGNPGHDWLSEVTARDPSADQLAFSGQVRDSIQCAMEKLTPQERTAFVLRHYEGLTVEEISSTLGIGLNAAKHSVFRAVRKLRRALEPLVASV
jgi:RNA polymerase sigma-70 factor, ECF subfamily